jgi:ribosomal protein S27E
MERKYRQRGYQEDSNAQRKLSKEKPKLDKSDFNYGSRPPRIETRFVEVTRCANCSTVAEVVSNSDFTAQCKKCGAELHSCKNCCYFDPAARFECQKPIEQRVVKKSEGNICLLFSSRVSLEKQQNQEQEMRRGNGEQSRPQNTNQAREAFENLFKK